LIDFPFERLESDFQTDKQRLDFLMLYLRRVHGYCFFCGVQAKDERALASKCASNHLRNARILARNEMTDEAKQFCHNVVKRAN
jgi:hypothetical protein